MILENKLDCLLYTSANCASLMVGKFGGRSLKNRTGMIPVVDNENLFFKNA
tara:strand:+ start:358 stop:510 length:153 start_codon:yes stop_codon:yes gene_type:complete